MAAPMNFHVRVKLFFENFAVQPTWLLLDQKDTRTIKKLCKIIYKNFIGEKTHLELYLENCRIPQWESTRILHDNDIIFVRALEKRTHNERLFSAHLKSLSVYKAERPGSSLLSLSTHTHLPQRMKLLNRSMYRISPFTPVEGELKQQAKKTKRKPVSVEETEKRQKRGNVEESEGQKSKEAKKRKLDDDTPISGGSSHGSRNKPRRLKSFSVGHLLQTQILGKNVSFSDEPNVKKSTKKDVTQCTDVDVTDNQEENDSAVDKDGDTVEENDKAGGDATPMEKRKRKRKHNRRKRKPVEGQNDSFMSGFGGGDQKSTVYQQEVSQLRIDPAPVNVKPPRTFRVDQKTYNSVGSYMKFDSDDEVEGNEKDSEMEVSMVSSTPKEVQMPVKDSNSFTSENRHQNDQMKVLSYTSNSDFQHSYNNKINAENWKERNNKIKYVNRTFDDSRTSQNGELQESFSRDRQETWQWGRGTKDCNVDSPRENHHTDSQNQEDNTENSEPEIVKSVLANGVAVYTRKRNQGRRSYTEMSKAQQLNTRLTNKSLVLKNPETVPEPKASPKLSQNSSSASSSSSSSSSSEDSSDEESVTKKSSQRQASNTEDSKALKFVAVPVFRDYSRFPPLSGPPRQGDTIAYKILEMSSSYTPEVSDFKEASVMKYDHDMKTVELKLQQQLSKKNTSGKFEVDIDEDEDFTMSNDLNEAGNLTLQWTSLLDPRLVTD